MNRFFLVFLLIVVVASALMSADFSVNNAMLPDGTNADNPVFPGSVTVSGAFVASDGAEFRGTASAVKILGNPAAPVTSTDGKGGLDIWDNYLVLGADSNASTRTNGTNKIGGLFVPTRDNTKPPVSIIYGDSGSTANSVTIGYGTANTTAANRIIFATSNVFNSSGGGIRGEFNSTGQFLLATSAAAIDSAVKLKLNGGMEIASGGFLLVGTDTREVGYGATIASGAYVLGDVSADQFTDRSDAPESLAEAYAIVQSHEVKDGKVDHSKLHSAAWGRKYRLVSTGKPVVKWRDVEQENSKGEKISVPESYEEPEILTVSEPDKQGRNLSMVISAQALVIADLTKRLEALEAK